LTSHPATPTHLQHWLHEPAEDLEAVRNLLLLQRAQAHHAHAADVLLDVRLLQQQQQQQQRLCITE
jgi:hypothetical protein